MAEQEPPYGYHVEKYIETSGPDIGRVKDEDAAKIMADRERDRKADTVSGGDTQEERLDEHTRHFIGSDAIKDSHLTSDILDAALGNGINGKLPDPDYKLSPQFVISNANDAKDNAQAAIKSYDDLLEVSKPANQEQEAARDSKLIGTAAETISRINEKHDAARKEEIAKAARINISEADKEQA